MKHIRLELTKAQTKKLKKLAELAEDGTRRCELGIVLGHVFLHEKNRRLENAYAKAFFLPNKEGLVAVKVLEYLIDQVKLRDEK